MSGTTTQNYKPTKTLLLALSLVLLMLLGACQPVQPEQPGSTVPAAEASDQAADEGEVITLFVASQRAECMGVAPMMCLRVRQSPDADWQFFYSNIDGFIFVPGYNYELRVRTFPIANPPADGSSIGYTLEEVISMTPDYAGDALPLVGTAWSLLAFGVEENVAFDAAEIEVTALFAEDGSLSGSAGCNRFMSSYTVDGTILRVGPLATTRMLCAENVMAVENAFVAGFAGDHEFVINGDKLEIIYAAGQLIFQGQ